MATVEAVNEAMLKISREAFQGFAATNAAMLA
jgi:hypothetical protein